MSDSERINKEIQETLTDRTWIGNRVIHRAGVWIGSLRDFLEDDRRTWEEETYVDPAEMADEYEAWLTTQNHPTD